MQVTNKAFKAYDVRGVYPAEVNEEMAYRMDAFFQQCLLQKLLLSDMISA